MPQAPLRLRRIPEFWRMHPRPLARHYRHTGSNDCRPKQARRMRPDPGKSMSTAQHLLEDVRRRQQELVARLQGGQESLKRLARSVWRVQEQEQRKLARELHDGIGQNLAALVRLIERAQSAPADAGSQLEQARALAATTLQETRALSRLLRPQILDDLGLAPAL